MDGVLNPLAAASVSYAAMMSGCAAEASPGRRDTRSAVEAGLGDPAPPASNRIFAAIRPAGARDNARVLRIRPA